MIIDFEKPYIKVGRKKVELLKGDYILDNGACLQFCPNEDNFRSEAVRYMGDCDYCCYMVSKNELKRLLNSYNFIRKVRTEYYVNDGSYTYPINAGRFITEYFFIGRKSR